MNTKTLQIELARIQKELNAPKNQYNKFGKYAYRSCEDILEGLKKVLGECTVTISDDMVMVGTRIYVKATATIQLGSEKQSVTAFAREEENKKGMDSAQLTGSTSSYARKYAMNGLFLIDDNKDADSNERAQQISNTPISQSMGMINTALQAFDVKFVKDNWGTTIKAEWHNLTPDQAEALNKLNAS